jgi:hypothetical protein
LAPTSRSASSASMSSLLAAQCSGVSVWSPMLGASTSAPAVTRAAMVPRTFGKWPGQSVATCRRVRSPWSRDH